jgi:hypothetical protein
MALAGDLFYESKVRETLAGAFSGVKVVEADALRALAPEQAWVSFDGDHGVNATAVAIDRCARDSALATLAEQQRLSADAAACISHYDCSLAGNEAVKGTDGEKLWDGAFVPAVGRCINVVRARA